MTNSTENSQRQHNTALLMEKYRRHPELYALHVLGVEWTTQQIEIARAVLKYKRVLVKASHSIGKSHLTAGLINWFFDCFDPSVSLTTAPTKLQVTDILWKEIRVQRRGRPGLQPKAPRMETAPNHTATGYTAFSDDAFQGRHEERVFIAFDECVGIGAEFWDAAEGMLTGEECYMLAVCNPTDNTSRAYVESEINDKFHVISVSALDHPNIAAELAGLPAPFPAAVRLEWVNARLKEWCDPLPKGDQCETDVEFPPCSGQWYRPGALFESRVLGRFPSEGISSVWSDALWNACLKERKVNQYDHTPIVSCDVARFGDDNTSIFVRIGSAFIHHESHNGWSTARTAGQLKRICIDLARQRKDGLKAEEIPVFIDADGVGGGVVDQKDGYNFIDCSASHAARQKADYPNARSEMWFNSAQMAREGQIDLTRLSDATLQKLRRQLMSPTYSIDSQGRRAVEKKDETKKRLKMSPDEADAFNLNCYARNSRITYGEKIYR